MSKMSIKERVAVTARGFSLLDKYCHGLPQLRALSALITTLQPFASIYISALIVNEISGEKSLNRLILYVCLLLTVNLAASLLKGVLDKINDQKESQMWSFFGRVFSDSAMKSDYADLENAEIQNKRKAAEENLFMFGNGLAQLVWGTSMLVTSTVNIVVSISMTVTLFIQRSDNALLNSPIWIFVLAAAILSGSLCNKFAIVRENDVFREWCKKTVWFNRTFMFYGRELYFNSERAKDVRIYNQQRLAKGELGGLLKFDIEDNNDINAMATSPAIAAAVIGVGNAACYIYVALKAFYGAFGVGGIVQYVGALTRLGDGLQEFMYILGDNETYCIYLKELFEYLDLPNKSGLGKLDVGGGEHVIEFHDVSFKYPSSDSYALRNVSVRLEAGKRTAIVGLNGSGKTTFIKLLCRLYEPDEGFITLDGKNINEYDYNEYMKIFAVVFQDFKLFSFNVAQNVAAEVNFDRERVLSCLDKAGFSERLSGMKDGIDTCLYKDFDKDGVEISGGEAQKLALARALYKDAPFIVLDEPTAALDPVAEAEIYSRFNQLIGDKTAVFISHRLSSCRFCDDIIVFDGGMIIQRGTHDELLNDIDGRYSELWTAQAKYYVKQ